MFVRQKNFYITFCKHKDLFGSLCKFMAKKPAVSTADEFFHNQNSKWFTQGPFEIYEHKFCGVMNA